jgi:serine phosphatase RsbU (regulator of sigma subunit)
MVVADVAGKGMASAIMSTELSARHSGRWRPTGMPLDELATRMNQHHWAEGEEARRRYVTAIFLRLHPEAGEIEVVNAGHNPGFSLLQPGSGRRACLRLRARRWGCCRGCATRVSGAGFRRERGCCFIPTG